jgi:hypothetical protein
MRGPPLAPVTATTLPLVLFVTMMGLMADRGRLPGSIKFASAGCGVTMLDLHTSREAEAEQGQQHMQECHNNGSIVQSHTLWYECCLSIFYTLATRAAQIDLERCDL